MNFTYIAQNRLFPYYWRSLCIIISPAWSVYRSQNCLRRSFVLYIFFPPLNTNGSHKVANNDWTYFFSLCFEGIVFSHVLEGCRMDLIWATIPLLQDRDTCSIILIRFRSLAKVQLNKNTLNPLESHSSVSLEPVINRPKTILHSCIRE